MTFIATLPHKPLLLVRGGGGVGFALKIFFNVLPILVSGVGGGVAFALRKDEERLCVRN